MPNNSLSDAMNVSIKRAMNEIHTALPGQVESYDHETQKASVKPCIKKKYRDGQAESLPVIVDVPVIWPRVKEASFTMPVNKGDYVLLIFIERSMERFLSLGEEQEPGDTRKFDLSDAVAIPGLFPFSEESLSENNEDVLLIYKENKIRITEEGNLEIEVEQDWIVDVKGDAEITIEGDATIEVQGDCDITIGGDAIIDVAGSVDLTAGSDVNVTAPDTTIDSEVTINGNLTVNGTITATGDVTGSGISLSTHTHPGVEAGPADTGPPQ